MSPPPSAFLARRFGSDRNPSARTSCWCQHVHLAGFSLAIPRNTGAGKIRTRSGPNPPDLGFASRSPGAGWTTKDLRNGEFHLTSNGWRYSQRWSSLTATTLVGRSGRSHGDVPAPGWHAPPPRGSRAGGHRGRPPRGYRGWQRGAAGHVNQARRLVRNARLGLPRCLVQECPPVVRLPPEWRWGDPAGSSSSELLAGMVAGPSTVRCHTHGSG